MTSFFCRFDGQSRLLLHSLMSGTRGVHRAVEVFRKQQRSNSDSMILLHDFITTLCQDEVDAAQTDGQSLTVKPLVCLFPALFTQNLLSFINLIHPVLPQTSVLHLLKCLSQDPHPNPWTSALCRQLKRRISAEDDEPLYTPQCSQRLTELSQRLPVEGRSGGWSSCFSKKAESFSQHSSGSSNLGTQRKRKISVVILDTDDEDAGLQRKRMRTDACGRDGAKTDEQTTGGETSDELEERAATERSTVELQPELDTSDSLPEHVKASVLQIKELLENQTEWDQGSTDVWKVLNECDPNQVEVFCTSLGLCDLPEETLPKLCSSVLTLSPDLSYSSASSLIKSLFLYKVLSLSEPASRCLVTAVTSLCGHYPRPSCHALIGPILREENIGNPQAELLKRLIEGCFDSHYRLLLLQMTFKIPWSETLLSVIHSLLDSKLDLNEEVFTEFTQHLVNDSPKFTKSVTFAKMMLTVLTKYSKHVNATNKHSVEGCLTSHETFLKKSLQAALRKITQAK